MAEPTINLGNGNWAGKSGNTLGYYKEGERFYKQDFTFSRSTTGTYTDKDGYIQEMPYNLLQYSEDFSQGIYIKNNASVTSNNAISPDGTLNADKFVENNANSTHSIYNNVVNGIGDFTISMFAKSAERSRVGISNGTASRKATFNLSNATISDEAGVSASMVSFGNGWYRCIISYNTTSVNDEYFNINIANNSGDFAYQGDGSSGLYIYGAQVEQGTSAKTYFPTTTRLNIPRVDYLNNSKGSLILEPQRSNLVTYSSDFSHSSYIRNQTTATTGFISPDGNLNAYKLLEDNTNNIHRIYQTATVTGSPNTTISVYVKYLGRKNVLMRIADSTVGRWYDIENGVLGGIYQGAPDNSSIEYVSNGWYRISITHTVSNQCRLELWVSNTESTSAYQGDTTKGVYLFGAQLEVGSYPTSYIPTSGSSVTRNADACSLTNVADRINSTEGVLFAEIAALASPSNAVFISLNDGSASNKVAFYFDSNNIKGEYVVSGATQSSFTYTPSDITSFNKIAFSYKLNEFKMFANGSQVSVTDTSGSVNPANTFNEIKFDYGNSALKFEGKLKDLKVYNTALTDTELAELTTL